MSGANGAGSNGAASKGAGADDSSRQPTFEEASNEVEHPASATRMPGEHRGGYTTMPTGPVDVGQVVASGPADTAGMSAVQWAPHDAAMDDDNTRLAPWALVAAVVALCASFFVGWGIPLAVIAVIAAIMSLRRPVENRAIAVWALILGIAATIYSLGWLIWAAMQFEAIG
ncbi:hypothetical protein DC31_17080 [Microbacterium sp. CH12i]|uniref:hypothetical protein n=1 Tax=Microbacterium sp. CH12i TaxID=1479651 RepID=UPI00046171D5|nr:hypothetical protein [Microbacterium sp. CH12i]KDA05268.1 hypothetical protein DC31_17080 [Microbacterium sp. CH12i]